MSNSLTQIGKIAAVASKLKLMDFDQVNKLGTLEEKREQLLGRCQEIYAAAHDRQRMLKGGDTTPDPDYHGMVKCVELTANLMGLIADATRKVNKPDEAERRQIDIEEVARMMRSIGYKVEKAA